MSESTPDQEERNTSFEQSESTSEFLQSQVTGFAYGRPLTLRYQNVSDDSESISFDSLLANHKIHLSRSVDLSEYTLPVREQGTLGNCVSFTLCTIASYLLSKDGNHKPHLFSPLFLYYATRMLDEDRSTEDSGSTLRQGLRALQKYGVAREKFWPWNPKRLHQKPPPEAWKDAKKHRLLQAVPVARDLPSIQKYLSASYLIAFGLLLYESIEKESTKRTGKIPYPDMRRERKLGGHAVVATGYVGLNRDKGYFIIQNSWGKNVGREGFFHLPYRYILNSKLCSEIFCVMRMK